MTRRQDCTAFKDPANYGMGERLAQEAKQKSDVLMLFTPHRVADVSSELSVRKLGMDFFLHPRLPGGEREPIRCENKFEQKATGRAVYELISVDRPRITPGWIYTSTTAWVNSWFPSGEMLAVHMDEIRPLVLPRPGMFKSTTAPNATYMSWSALVDVNVVLDRCPSARVVDLSHDLGDIYAERPMVHGRHKNRICTSEELVELMVTLPPQSTPVPVTQEELVAVVKAMLPNNFKAQLHRERIAQLAYLRD